MADDLPLLQRPARRSEPNGNSAALVKATLTIAAINQWL
jgi:hypothetical protein